MKVLGENSTELAIKVLQLNETSGCEYEDFLLVMMLVLLFLF